MGHLMEKIIFFCVSSLCLRPSHTVGKTCLKSVACEEMYGF